MKHKSHCCEKFRSKAKACKGCPLFAGLGGSKRKKRLKKIRRKLKKAA